MTLIEINEYLDRTYGRQDPNYPRFRVVFSDEIKEIQVVKYDYLYGDMEVSRAIEREEQPKYPWIHGCFIFELHCPTDHEDIVDHAGNYEPIYIYRDKDNNPLPLDLEITQMLAKALSEKVERKTPGQLKTEYDEKMRKAAELEFQMLDDAVPYIPSLMKMGEGVFMDSTKKFNGKA